MEMAVVNTYFKKEKIEEHIQGTLDARQANPPGMEHLHNSTIFWLMGENFGQ